MKHGALIELLGSFVTRSSKRNHSTWHVAPFFRREDMKTIFHRSLHSKCLEPGPKLNNMQQSRHTHQFVQHDTFKTNNLKHCVPLERRTSTLCLWGLEVFATAFDLATALLLIRTASADLDFAFDQSSPGPAHPPFHRLHLLCYSWMWNSLY